MQERDWPSISIRKTIHRAVQLKHAAYAMDTAILAAGYDVIGVSKDSAASHQKFAAKHALPFTLVADTDLRLNEAFGVWQKKKMAGREYMGTVRTTFLIDEKGIVTDIIKKVDTKNSARQILDSIK